MVEASAIPILVKVNSSFYGKLVILVRHIAKPIRHWQKFLLIRTLVFNRHSFGRIISQKQAASTRVLQTEYRGNTTATR